MSENSDAKQRLLIVDDSKVIRVTARKILQNDFETVEAVDGENAWEILNGMGPFALVISDLTMPKLDGYGLLEKIRSAHNPDISDIPVIIITGDSDSESTMQRAREAGATDFIGKPFDAVHLKARAQSHAIARVEKQTLTEQKLALEERVQVDALTGLPNEAAFMERGKQQLSYAIRHDSRLAVAQVEIDNYGELYRQYGDPVAEMMVKHTASVLEGGIREEDMAARIGTARFAMLLTAMEPIGIQALTDRISKDISGHVVRDGDQEVHFAVSIGICTQDIQSDTRFYDLFTTAGNELQQAIRESGSRVVLDNPPDSGDQSVDGPVAEADPGDSSADHEDGTDATAVIDDTTVETRQQTLAEVDKPLHEAETVQQDAEELLPEMFAEPLAGGSKKLAARVARANKLAGAEEEIVISSFDSTASDLPQEQGDTADHGQTWQAPESPEADIPDTDRAPRKGLFSRIFAMFRRSGR